MRAIQCNVMCVNSQASFRFILLDMYDKVSSISSTGMAFFKLFVRSSNFEKICLLRIFSMGETNKFNFKPKISLFVDIRHLKYVWCMSKVKDKRNCDSNLVQKTEKNEEKNEIMKIAIATRKSICHEQCTQIITTLNTQRTHFFLPYFSLIFLLFSAFLLLFCCCCRCCCWLVFICLVSVDADLHLLSCPLTNIVLHNNYY